MPPALELLLCVIGGFLSLIGMALIVTSLIIDLPVRLREMRDRRADRALREMKYFNILIR